MNRFTLSRRPQRRSFVPRLDILEDRTVPSTTLGPLIDLSDPDVLAACGSNGSEKESYIVVNPTNPNNIVATWFGGLALGTVTAVTLDGGANWQQVIIPGATECTGGTPEFQVVADPWLAFAPNGDLYQSCAPFNNLFYRGPSGLLVSKSVDGGLHWTSQVLLDVVTDKQMTVEKPSITADPSDSHFVYAMWSEQFIGGNTNLRGHTVLRFARTTDGGATWEPARTIYDPGSNNQAWGGVVAVLPDGTLVATFLQLRFSNNNGSGQKDAVLSVMRSTDHGQTWSAPIQGPIVPSFDLADPENGFPITNMASYPPLLAPVTVDSNTGNIYLVFEDNRFSVGQYSNIAFTMSADGGRTWSNPIPVNQTPTNIPPGNRNAFLPSVAVADDGTIGVTYYDLRFNDARAGLPTDYWLVTYHPSETTTPTDPANWGGEVRLTNSSFNLEGAPTGTGAYFIGDYEGLATDGNDFLAAWGQPHGTDRDSVFFRRAYDSPTPLNDAALVSHDASKQILPQAAVTPMLTEALARWTGTGVDPYAIYYSVPGDSPGIFNSDSNGNASWVAGFPVPQVRPPVSIYVVDRSTGVVVLSSEGTGFGLLGALDQVFAEDLFLGKKHR